MWGKLTKLANATLRQRMTLMFTLFLITSKNLSLRFLLHLGKKADIFTANVSKNESQKQTSWSNSKRR